MTKNGFFQKSDGLVMSWNGVLQCVMEWNVGKGHGMECWDVFYYGMLGRVIEWNACECHSVECWDMSWNTMFGSVIKWTT